MTAVPSFELAPGVRVGGDSPLCVFVGPCVLESRELAVEVA